MRALGLTAQLSLAFAPPSVRREDFVVSPANREAVAAVEAWPAWPGGALALVGPPGSGKSHLAALWAERAVAQARPAATLDRLDGDAKDGAAPAGPVLVEGADDAPAAEALFHLLNRAASGQASVLLTARTAPRLWRTAVPDLRSRLNALAVAELGEPDDAALEALLSVFFRQRRIRPSPELLGWLVRRIERSARGAETAAARLDEAALAAGRPVSRALAREVFGDGPHADDSPELPFG